MSRNDADDVEAQTVAARLAGRPIVLIGLMGCGKTAIGQRLATRLNLPFVDADAEVEAAAGMTIAEIFERQGEPAFRRAEARVITRLLEEGPRVVATGGGAFMNPDTRAAIAKTGISVWLKANLTTLMARVRKRETRPLLKTSNSEAVMQRLMTERYPVYAQADLTVVSRNGPHNAVVDAVVQALAGSSRLTASG